MERCGPLNPPSAHSTTLGASGSTLWHRQTAAAWNSHRTHLGAEQLQHTGIPRRLQHPLLLKGCCRQVGCPRRGLL